MFQYSKSKIELIRLIMNLQGSALRKLWEELLLSKFS